MYKVCGTYKYFKVPVVYENVENIVFVLVVI